jgi:drug/metabolite transporter (DMT)-like permease
MDNLKGMGWMTLAMLAFAITDMTIIFTWPRASAGADDASSLAIGGAISSHLGAAAGPSLAVARAPDAPGDGAQCSPRCWPPSTSSARSALIPLSTLSAVIQANPLLVTLGAALFLGEEVGWRRWSAIAVGLFGVLLIIRPGSEGFDPNIWLAVVAAVGLSLRDLATRPVPGACRRRCWRATALRRWHWRGSS